MAIAKQRHQGIGGFDQRQVRRHGGLSMPAILRHFDRRARSKHSLGELCDVLRLFVRLELFDEDQAAGMLTWPHSGFHVPTAGPETVDPLEYLARVLVHIPDKGHVATRYCGWYANRPCGMRPQAEPAAAAAPPPIVPALRLALTEGTRRWADLLQQIFDVDPLACPTPRDHAGTFGVRDAPPRRHRGLSR